MFAKPWEREYRSRVAKRKGPARMQAPVLFGFEDKLSVWSALQSGIAKAPSQFELDQGLEPWIRVMAAVMRLIQALPL